MRRSTYIARHGAWRGAYVAATVLVLGGGLALSGCGAAAYSSCEVDSDCDNDEICVRERCAPECSSDEDCDRPGYTCQPHTASNRRDSVYICTSRDVGGDTDGGQTCSSDQDCRRRIDAGPTEQAFCDPFGDCRVGDIVHGVSIVDRTPPDNSDDDGDGAEIAAVYLIDQNGEIVGLGETVDYTPARESNTAVAVDAGLDADTTDGMDGSEMDATGMDAGVSDTSSGDVAADVGSMDSVSDTAAPPDGLEDGRSDGSNGSIEYRSTIDGRPVLDESGRCIDGSEHETTPLGGESGRLVVQFVDSTGAPILVEQDQRIVVIEWGTNCDSDDSERDRFRVSFCKSVRNRIVPENDCNTRIGEGDELQGYNAMEPPGDI